MFEKFKKHKKFEKFRMDEAINGFKHCFSMR